MENTNTLTHGSLFSGIGGAELAATWMGWHNAFHCEIDDFARTILEYHYPNAESYADIKTTDFTKWNGKIDLLTGGFPCFVQGTPVLTKRGYVPIEEIEIGDNVLSCDRTYHRVEATMQHTADKIVYLRAQGMHQELKCTPNHPFYIMRKETRYVKGMKQVVHLNPEYINASEIRKGDKVGYPVFEGTDTSYSKAFWKLVGTWIADGWLQNGKRKGRKNSREYKVVICCGKHHIARLHRIIQAAGYKYTLSEERTVYRCIINNKWLCDFLKGFGKYAYGKHLSLQCFILDRERKQALLEGWFADGFKKDNGAQCVTTVSERLALEMAAIARDVYRCPVSISKKTCNRVCVIEGRTVNERPQYCVNISNSSRYGFYDNGFVWCNVKSVREEQEINQVFNLSVNEEHSYNVYGIAVHNCQPFSSAGKRKGTDDDRYLWPQMLRAIREIKPAFIVAENVNGILSILQPCQTVRVESQADLFGTRGKEEVAVRRFVIADILDQIEAEGYAVQPIVIPACAIGAPHRRDRVWIIAVRQDVADTGQYRPRQREDKQEPKQECQGTPDTRIYGETRASLYTDSNRLQRWSDAQLGSTSTISVAVSNTSLPNERIFDNHECIGRHTLSVHNGKPHAPQQEQCGKEQPLGTDSAQSNAWGDTSDTDSLRYEGRNAEENGVLQQTLRLEALHRAGDWRDFPTQSPVRFRDDGLFPSVDDLTVPLNKWRKESIRCLGNAWVPGVAYEIFKAIEKTYINSV